MLFGDLARLGIRDVGAVSAVLAQQCEISPETSVGPGAGILKALSPERIAEIDKNLKAARVTLADRGRVKRAAATPQNVTAFSGGAGEAANKSENTKTTAGAAWRSHRSNLYPYHFPLIPVPHELLAGLDAADLRSILETLQGAAVPPGVYASFARRAVADYVKLSRSISDDDAFSVADAVAITWWWWGRPIRYSHTEECRPYSGCHTSECRATSNCDSRRFTAPAFFSTFAVEAAARLEEMHPVLLVCMLWVLCNAEVVDHGFFQVVGDCLMRLLDRLDRESLGLAAWCFAKACEPHPHLFQLISRDVVRRQCVREDAVAKGDAPPASSCLTPSSVENLFWALGRLARSTEDRPFCEEFVEALQGCALHLFSHQTPQQILDSSLCPPHLLADGSMVGVEAFNLESCAIMARACVDLRMEDQNFFLVMAKYVTAGIGRESPDLAEDWFLSRSGSELRPLLAAYAQAAVPRKQLRTLAEACLPHVVSRWPRLCERARCELQRDLKAGGAEAKLLQRLEGNGYAATAPSSPRPATLPAARWSRSDVADAFDVYDARAPANKNNNHEIKRLLS